MEVASTRRCSAGPSADPSPAILEHAAAQRQGYEYLAWIGVSGSYCICGVKARTWRGRRARRTSATSLKPRLVACCSGRTPSAARLVPSALPSTMQAPPGRSATAVAEDRASCRAVSRAH